jgi:prepilin-type N-terminal cleavage/methylation domain-containing protein
MKPQRLTRLPDGGIAFHRRWRQSRGFTMAEVVITSALIGILTAVASPLIFRMMRRERLRSHASEIYSQVLAARMQAVKRNTPVVLFFDLPNRDIISWAEVAPFDYVQNPATEPTLSYWQIPKYLLFSFAPGGLTDGANAVAFDTYLGNAAIVDKIIFLGDGTLLQPQAANSARPARPGTYTASVPFGSVNCVASVCRGVFISDFDLNSDPHRNVFRISVDDFGVSGKASLLKYLPPAPTAGGNAGEVNYVPGNPWPWLD